MRGIVGNVVLNTTTMNKVRPVLNTETMDKVRPVLNTETMDKVITLALSPICEDKRTTPRQLLLRGGFLLWLRHR